MRDKEGVWDRRFDKVDIDKRNAVGSGIASYGVSLYLLFYLDCIRFITFRRVNSSRSFSSRALVIDVTSSV